FSLSYATYAQKDIRKQLQTQFIMAEPGETIKIPKGTYRSSGSISMDEKQDIVIQGAGIDQTIISFKGQIEGAEGVRIDNSQNIILRDMTLQDAKGDLVKVMNTKGIKMINVKVEWTGKPNKKNGAYGLYPVACSEVVIDGCVAIGASDAGIYVGQSHNIVVRNSEAYHNVAGIEIENSTMADVYNCTARENTGGILIFDLPDLPKKKGGNVRVYENIVEENNYKNFAPKGNIVGFVPPGTGIIILATSDVEVFDNQVKNHKTFGLSIASYYITENEINDDQYDPYPTRIFVHDNVFTRERQAPTFKHKLGLLAFKYFKKEPPMIWFDGILDKERVGASGLYPAELQICIQNNQNGTFVNLDAENGFESMSQDLSMYDCSHPSLAAPEMSATDSGAGGK
ncbi:MAG: parallel beta-helix domain-containing protein, partial [Bacteroidota bacterium]